MRVIIYEVIEEYAGGYFYVPTKWEKKMKNHEKNTQRPIVNKHKRIKEVDLPEDFLDTCTTKCYPWMKNKVDKTWWIYNQSWVI